MRAAARDSRSRRGRPAALVAALVLLAGCPAAQPPPPTAAPRPAAPLVALVVDDPPLAAAIERLQGEWQAQGGGVLEVRQATAAELRERTELGADLVVFPERELGGLAERNWLAALDRDLEADAAYQWSDVFPQLRQGIARWGTETVALPLGSRVLLLAGQPGAAAPADWAELLARLESGEKPARIALPLGEGWAARTLLAWAAPYVRHPDYFSGLFNKDTFEPRIAGPAFVRALEELKRAAARGVEGQLALDPAEAWQAVARGEAEWAVGWPAAAGADPAALGDPPVDGPSAQVAAWPLPGSAEAYNPLRSTWDRVESGGGTVPLLGLEGRLAGVSVSAADGLAVYRLLALVTGPQWSGEIAPLSAATAPFRGRHASPPVWRPASPTDAAGYAQAVAASLSAPRALGAPRIPAAEDYLAALDRAVRKAVGGEAQPQAALDEAAEAWRRITAEQGLDRQRAAYQRSLGLSPR